MATPSLQDILATEPGLAARIDAMTELIPGVPASKENLKTLLEYVVKHPQLMIADSDDIYIEIVVGKLRKNKELLVSVLQKVRLGVVIRSGHTFRVIGSSVRKKDYSRHLSLPNRTENDTEKRGHVPTAIVLAEVRLYVRS